MTISYSKLFLITLTVLLTAPILCSAQRVTPGSGSGQQTPQVWHVDSKNGSDNASGIGHNSAFKTIQAAIFKARTTTNDTILIWPGIYKESINTLGKAITIASASEPAIIEGQNIAITCQTAENARVEFRNLIIRNCTTAVMLINSSPTFSNMTIAGNVEGIVGYGSSSPILENSILWNSRLDIVREKDALNWPLKANYCCFRTLNENLFGKSNFSKNPLFASLERGDFHLRSQRGHFVPLRNEWDIPGLHLDPNSTTNNESVRGFWILDSVTSPCVDAGSSLIKPVREKMPNGARINIGAYGNTPFASLSDWPLTADFNHDGIVNLIDAALFSRQWLDEMPWATVE